MVISSNINEYIKKSKINGRFLRWDKSVINVYTTPISAPVNNKEFLYSEIKRAMSVWNDELKSSGINLFLNSVNTPTNADIVIHWVKVGRMYEGMCKYPSVINGVLKKVSIDIGLENQFSGKNTTNESIFFVMLHELGHAIGLGHGVEVDDVMFVPHQKNVAIPSENDLYVLKQIYCK